jgi:hypothetical protein
LYVSCINNSLALSFDPGGSSLNLQARGLSPENQSRRQLGFTLKLRSFDPGGLIVEAIPIILLFSFLMTIILVP